MKSESPDEKWKRLTGLARETPPDEVPNDIPRLLPGFAARVATEWADAGPGQRVTIALFERAAWCGAGLATLACIAWVSLARPDPDLSRPLAFDSLLFAPDAPRNGTGPLF